MKGELFINNIRIDLSENIPVPMSFSIADIKEPEKRKRNYTKQIKLPGTKRNKSFFSSTYQLSLSSLESNTIGFEFDPTQKYPAVYVEDGDIIFIGLVQLMNVTINNKNYEFNISLYSNFVDLFQSLRDIKVSELGWSEYDHILSITNISNSWATSVIKNGVATANFTAGVPDGFGYVYPLADYGYSGNLRDYLTNNIYPHIFIREFMVKCFALAGLTISGDFIDSELLKRLVFGFGGGEKINLNPADVANRKASYDATGTFSEDITYSWYDYSNINNVYFYHYNYSKRLKIFDSSWSATTINVDPMLQFDETTGDFTVGRQGNYSMTFTGDVNITAPFTSSTNLRLLKNGALIANMIVTAASGVVTFDSTANFTANAGDIISIELVIGINKTFILSTLPEDQPTYTFGIADSGGWTFEMKSLGGQTVDGDNIYIANYIPDMKASELLSDIILAFNLYVDDPDLQGVCKVEPLEDFYFGANIFDDFTPLVDNSKEIKIYPSSQIKGKNYLFKFAEDNDFWNKYYRDTYGLGYGDKNYQVQSTFEKGERVYQLHFSQTIPVQVPGTNIVIPTIISKDETTGAVKPFKGKPRVYIYSGLRNSASWKLRNSATPGTFNTYTSYPCINHLDDVDSPTFDFNFEIPPYLQWSNANFVNINLFSENHEKFVREVTGKDSKILDVYIKADKSHVKPQSFRRFANIDGVRFRKNEISDYNGNGEETTKFELVRIVEGSRRRPIPILLPKDPGNVPRGSGGTNTVLKPRPVLAGGKNTVSINSPTKYG